MKFVLGGDFQKGSLNHVTGYSATAQCTGKPSYLEPNSQSMQKTIEGLLVLELLATNGMLEKEARTYLERIRNSMQKPIEGLSTRASHQTQTATNNRHIQTLIPSDTTLISATNASKTVLANYAKSSQKQMQRRTHTGCSVKGESNRLENTRIQNDTTHRQQQRRAHKNKRKRFTKRQTNTTKRPDTLRRLENGSA